MSKHDDSSGMMPPSLSRSVSGNHGADQSGDVAPGKRTATAGLRAADPVTANLNTLREVEVGLSTVGVRYLPTMRAAIDARQMQDARAAGAALVAALDRIDRHLASVRRWATIAGSAGALELLAPLEAQRDALRAEAAPVLALAPPAAPPLPVLAAFDFATMMDTAPAYDEAEAANRTAWDAQLDAAEAPRDNVIDAADRFGAVQRRATAGAARGPAAVQAHASAGVAGTGATLPHLDAIQSSFGAHDVTGVRAHVGGAAADASAAIGAEAYATGNDVAFASSPSLFVAAHEAAHVVQQRAGVSLLGGVGVAGDAYEQHADAVAETVVRGESAEGLLGPASIRNPSSGVQKREKKDAEGPSYETAASVLQAAADVVMHKRAKLITGFDAEFLLPLWTLYAVVTQKVDDGPLPDDQRRSSFEFALAGLKPAVATFEAEDPDWLATYYTPYIEQLRKDVLYSEAKGRVTNSIIVGASLIELNGEPRADGEALAAALPRLFHSLSLINEQMLRVGHHEIEHAAIEMIQEGELPAGMTPKTPLVYLQGLLIIAQGWLMLNDEELQEHLEHPHSVLVGVRSYAELVIAVTAMTGGILSMSFAYATAVAQANRPSHLVSIMEAGKEVRAAVSSSVDAGALGAGSAALLKVGKFLAWIELGYAVATVLDPDVALEAKLGTAVSGAAAGAFALSPSGAGGWVSLGLTVAYFELEYMLATLAAAWDMQLGLVVGGMSPAFPYILESGQTIASFAEPLTRSALLVASERDPERLDALQRVHEVNAHQLATQVDLFLHSCVQQGDERATMHHPGAHPILIDAFAEAVQHEGAAEPAEVAIAAQVVLERIAWTLQHAQELVEATANGHSYESVERAAEEEEAQRRDDARKEQYPDGEPKDAIDRETASFVGDHP